MEKRPKKSLLWRLFRAAFTLFFLGTVTGTVVAYHYVDRWVVNPAPGKELPDVEKLGEGLPLLVTKVYDRNGELMFELGTEKRTIVSYDEISPLFFKALIAAEDEEFLTHSGVNYWAIVKAIGRNGLNRLRGSHRRNAGASTLTQQIVKLYLAKDQSRTIERKVREGVLAHRLELRWTKQELLAFYANQVFYGNGRYGIEEAAQYYFGKSARQINLREAAVLAALPNGPGNADKVKWREEREKYVIGRMVKSGFITQAEADAALATPLQFVKHAPYDATAGVAPEWVDVTKNWLLKKYGANYAYMGLRVYLTCDLSTQKDLRAAVEKRLEWIDSVNGANPRPQGAAIVIDPATREVTAMVGGYHEGLKNEKGEREALNRALLAQRQPGSLAKVFVLAAALERALDPRFTLSTTLPDEVITYFIGKTPYAPRNHSPSNGEPVTLRVALAKSMNTIFVQLVNAIGPEAAADMAKRLGIESPLDAHSLTFPLGTSNVNLLEATNAYATIAAGGKWQEPRFVLRVDNNAVPTTPGEQRIKPEIAFLTASAMESVMKKGGTGVRAEGKLDRPVAGKTGTTQSNRDAWFIGFSKDLVAGVWVGYDNNLPLGTILLDGRQQQMEGSRSALLIWIDFMAKALESRPFATFDSSPPGVTSVNGEFYLAGTEPGFVPPAPPTDGGAVLPDGGFVPPATLDVQPEAEESVEATTDSPVDPSIPSTNTVPVEREKPADDETPKADPTPQPPRDPPSPTSPSGTFQYRLGE